MIASLPRLLFVGISLQSYYFYDSGMPLVSIVSLLIMGGIIFISSLNNSVLLMNKESIGVILGYLVIFLWSTAGLLFYGDSPNIKRLASFFVIIFSALVAGDLFRRIHLEDLLRTYLVVHVFFFFLQFILYYALDFEIDYLFPFTGEEQRLFYGSFTYPFTDKPALRATGLFNEPGTYATFVAPFIALFNRWYLKSVANKLLFWISLFSLFLNFSTFGIVFGVFILLFVGNYKIVYRSMYFFVCMALVAPFLYHRYVFGLSMGLETGLDLRRMIIENTLNFLLSNPLGFLFGSNLLVLDPRVVYVAAYNDVGLLLYFLHFAGPVLTLLFGASLMYLSLKCDGASRVAMLIVLLSKHSLFAPFFPFVLIAIFYKNRLANSRSLST